MSTTGPDIMSEDEGIESGNIKNDQVRNLKKIEVVNRACLIGQ